MPDEKYVVNLLTEILEKKVHEFNHLSNELEGLRNYALTDKVSDEFFQILNGDQEVMKQRRRELRGEMSALRQAIKKLEEDQ